MDEQTAHPLRKVIRYGLVLMCVCLVSGGGLGYFYWLFRDDIERKEKQEFDRSMAEVLGEGAEAAPVGEYPEKARDEDKVYVAAVGGAVRYAAMGSAQGYQSQIKVLVSVEAAKAETPVDKDPRIFRLVVVSSQETPGLGERIKEVTKEVSLWGVMAGKGKDVKQKRPAFQEQFSGKRLSDLALKPGSGPDAITPITGATISSTATGNAAREALRKIVQRTRQVYGKGN